MPAPPSLEMTVEEVDSKRLLVKRLPAGTVMEELTVYFMSVTSLEIISMTLGNKSSRVVLNLAQAPGQLPSRKICRCPLIFIKLLKTLEITI